MEDDRGDRLKHATDLLPLTEAYYYILVTLGSDPAHGYGIMQEIERMSSGRVQIGAGTMYTALSTLLAKGLIENAPVADGSDPRRKVYAITPAGVRTVEAEIRRLEELLANGVTMMEQWRE